MHNTRLGHVTFLLHCEQALVDFFIFLLLFFLLFLVVENSYLH